VDAISETPRAFISSRQWQYKWFLVNISDPNWCFLFSLISFTYFFLLWTLNGDFYFFLLYVNTCVPLLIRALNEIHKQSFIRYVWCSSPKLTSPKCRLAKFGNLYFGETWFRQCDNRQSIISTIWISIMSLSAMWSAAMFFSRW
jgi:hypothetical protein